MEKTKEEKLPEVKAPEVEEVKEVEQVPAVPEEIAPKVIERFSEEREEKPWIPKTSLGKQVNQGNIKSIDEILFSGKKILEPRIVDRLVPELKSELVLIGGRSGKGGGIQRIPIRITAKMHQSGRRFRTSALIIVGDGEGLVGVGRASSVEPRTSMEKALNRAKLGVIKIKRGCGDWECGCGTSHSIPYKIKGKSGSVRIELLPAPKGTGLVADNESKKLLKLAGLKDIWVKALGNTGNRINLIYAVYDALKRLYIYQKS